MEQTTDSLANEISAKIQDVKERSGILSHAYGIALSIDVNPDLAELRGPLLEIVNIVSRKPDQRQSGPVPRR